MSSAGASNIFQLLTVRRRSPNNARQGLLSWFEAWTMVKYKQSYRLVEQEEAQISTVAVAFSPDGKTIASTHGDCTVKLTDCATGKLTQVLPFSLRTPWTVRFHPLLPDILASGSLSHIVQSWDAKTAQNLWQCDLTSPIASIAFHAQKSILAIAAGHELFVWNYGAQVGPPPCIILRTPRVLRGVLFHPYLAPYILTAEVNDEPFSKDLVDVSRDAAEAAVDEAELSFTVKIRVWSYDVNNLSASLKMCHLTISHSVLSSEMGVDFSPCGRYLALCEATVRADDSDFGAPLSAPLVIYELRMYSLAEDTFGLLLSSRPIKVGQCSTSVQFSPRSEHILLAYGQQHVSLRRSNDETTVPVYTILEMYRVPDMKLVRVLSSEHEEVNAACFNPIVGGGLAYGTTQGKLVIRMMAILKYEPEWFEIQGKTGVNRRKRADEKWELFGSLC